MGFTMPPVSGVIGIVCAGVGLLFQIVGVATAGWITIDLPPGAGGSIDYGLWEICPPSGSCVDFPIVEDWLKACRAFGILGLLVLAGCLVVGILIGFLENVKLPVIAAALGFVSGLLILIEFAVYAGEAPSSTTFSYSFALTIVACLLGVAAGICFLLAKKA